MATRHTIKRMARERLSLDKPSKDYVVAMKDDNLLQFDAYVIGPSETLYSHKFIKLRIKIPNDYPLVPPDCKFIQHSGGRIHPNLYTDGKVCLSILGTWEGEKWAMAMTCETVPNHNDRRARFDCTLVLVTIRSLLDNKPYTHEPGQSDNPAYNDYVQYGTWRWLLLDYVRREQDPKLKSFLQNYVATHGDEMILELQCQAARCDARLRVLDSPYGGRDTHIIPDYVSLIQDLKKCVLDCRMAVAREVQAAMAAEAAMAASTTGPDNHTTNESDTTANTQQNDR